MMSLAGACAEGACAARRRAAVVTVRRHHPRRLRWRHALVFLASLPIGVGVLLIVPLGLLAGGLLARRLGWPAGTTAATVAAVAAFCTIAAVVVACVAPGLGAVAPRDRALAREWAGHHGVVLLEASMLVAATDQPRAATVLVRRLLAHADRNQFAVIARPRNPQVAGMYRALRFAPLPAGSGRILLRPHQTAAGAGEFAGPAAPPRLASPRG